MTLRNKSILVTGGAGFIGSHLVDRLVKEEPSNLVVVDNFYLGKESNLQDAKRNFPELKIMRMDASDETSMDHLIVNEEVEVVFNLAIIPLPIRTLSSRSVIPRIKVDQTANHCNGIIKTNGAKSGWKSP